MNSTTSIGVIGCGNISGIYLKNLARFENLEVVAVADIDPERAAAQAAAFNVPRAASVDEILSCDDIEIIVNLTIPAAHSEIALRALQSGKSVYNEKPLALDRMGAKAMMDLARSKGLRIGCAPDTVLGAGIQTCRQLLDAGAIGLPVAAVGFMLGGGPEAWHPAPSFFYRKGGGPLFDMGPYYLTALTTLLGPVCRASASARVTCPQRVVGSGPHAGQLIDVETPTHIAGLLDFVSGPVGTLITSFDIPGGHHLPCIEIYGTEGSLQVSDPNTFGGPVLLQKAGQKEWREMPIPFGYDENSRGLGVADLAAAIRCKRPHRANDEIACHVLDLMHILHESSASNSHILVGSSMVRPAPLPQNLTFGQVPD